MKLSEKQKRFCDYYIELGNATNAAIKAGYSKKTAKIIGYENLTKPNLKNYIDEKLKALEDERIASATEVLQLLTSAARGELEEEVVINEGLGNGVTQVQKVMKKISLKDRIKAAELLGKRHRLFTDKVEVEGTIPVMIVGEDDLDD